MRRVVLDSNGVNPLVERPGALDVIDAAIRDGELEILGTHILADELAATPDPAKRALLERILEHTSPVSTAGFIFGVSKLGQAEVSSDADVAHIDHLRAGRTDGKHTNDALLAITAGSHGVTLVTADKGLTGRVQSLNAGIEVLHPDALLAELGYAFTPAMIDRSPIPISGRSDRRSVMPRTPSKAQRAEMLLNAAQDSDLDPNDAAVMRQEAIVLAMLAIAEEIAEVRGHIGGVQRALEDTEGFGAGLHLHYISDWLKDIAEKR